MARRPYPSDDVYRACVYCHECGRLLRRTPEQIARGKMLCPLCLELSLTFADEPDESATAWARRVWAAWSPAERAEVAGALESWLEMLRGGGQGASALHRGGSSLGAVKRRKLSLAEDLAARSTSGRAPGTDRPVAA